MYASERCLNLLYIQYLHDYVYIWFGVKIAHIEFQELFRIDTLYGMLSAACRCMSTSTGTHKFLWNSHEEFLAQDYKLNTCRLTQIEKIFSVGFRFGSFGVALPIFVRMSRRQTTSKHAEYNRNDSLSKQVMYDGRVRVNKRDRVCGFLCLFSVKWAKWRLPFQTLMGTYRSLCVCKTYIIHFLPPIAFVNHPNKIWHWLIDTKD